MEIILIRHAETDDNERGVVHGHSQGTLTAGGQQQARDLAAKLKNDNIAAIYSSDFQRCVDTAKLIHVYHQNIPLEFAPELREMSGGKFNKAKVSPKRALKIIQILKMLHLKTPNGESWSELCLRVGNFLNETYEKHSNDIVVMVTHGIAMQAIRSIIDDTNKNSKLEEVPNCTVWHLEMKSKFKLKAQAV